MNTKIITAREAARLLVKHHPIVLRDAWYPILFCGDRLSCSDEAAILEFEGKIVALATIAPEGEMGSGNPTIVGLYTIRPCRRKGYGEAVLEAAIRRCLERGFSKIRIDVISPNAMKVIEALPMELQSVLDANKDFAFGGFLE